MPSISKAVQYLQETKKLEDHEDIFLDDIEVKKFDRSIIKEFKGLPDIIHLTMNTCGLTSLRGFPVLPELIRLELIENQFPGADLVHLSGLKELQSLSIGENKIEKLSQLKPLSGLVNLTQLDLVECPIAKLKNYRKDVFALIPSLRILDNLDAEGNEYEYSEDPESEEEHEHECGGEDHDCDCGPCVDFTTQAQNGGHNHTHDHDHEHECGGEDHNCDCAPCTEFVANAQNGL